MPDRRIRRIARTVVAALLALVLIAAAGVVVLRLTNPSPKHKQIGWLRVQDMPSPRGETAFAMNGLRLIVAGGLSGIGRTSNVVDIYDVSQRQWFIGSPLPARRHHAAGASLGDYIYVTGGAASVTDSTPRADVWRFEPGYKWSRVASMPEGRVGHAMVSFESRIYVFGGIGRTNDTLIFDGNRWTRGAPLPAGRNHLRAVVWGKQIWVIGGRTSHLTARIDIYDPATDHWRRGPDLPKPMSAMVVGILDDNLHVIGGEDPAILGGRVLKDHFFLHAGSTNWERRSEPLLPVHGAAFGTAPSVLFIAGGAARAGATSVLSWTGVTQIYSTIPQQLL